MGRSRGARNISRLLKRLPDTVSDEIRAEMNSTGKEIADEMRGRTPVRTGALQSGISFKVTPKTLKLQVGLLGTPTGRAKLFYGRIVDLGWTARNGRKIPGRHFVTGSYKDLRTKMTANLKDIWSRALTKASVGGSEE